MKSKYLLSTVVLITVLLAASGVRAEEMDKFIPLSSLPSYGVPVLRSCTIKLGTDGPQHVTILAGPDEKGGTNTAFPVTCSNGKGLCSCGDRSINPTCLQWQYRWTINGLPEANLTNALISAASNVTVFSSDPAGARVLQPPMAQGERFLDFSVNGGRTFTASYFTPLNVTPGTLTAGFEGRNGRLPLRGHCALAGAANLTVAQNQAVPVRETRTFATPGSCVASLLVDPSSDKVIPGTIKLVGGSPTDCSVSETSSFQVDNKPVIYAAAGQWTELGSCCYCFVNTGGGKTCMCCTTCKVVNGVCTR